MNETVVGNTRYSAWMSGNQSSEANDSTVTFSTKTQKFTLPAFKSQNFETVNDPLQRSFLHFTKHGVVAFFQVRFSVHLWFASCSCMACDILQNLTADLVFKKPEDPLQYMIDACHQRKLEETSGAVKSTWKCRECWHYWCSNETARPEAHQRSKKLLLLL